jgi:hypothetical protein
MEEKLQNILDSLINGQRRQMTEYIDEEELYDFWADVKSFIDERYYPEEAYSIFSDMVISYFRIKNR